MGYGDGGFRSRPYPVPSKRAAPFEKRVSNMTSIFAHRSYRQLFAAHVIALFGTGLATVALALLAYELAGANAGTVLGTALSIKMVCYVIVSQIAGANADRLRFRWM